NRFGRGPSAITNKSRGRAVRILDKMSATQSGRVNIKSATGTSRPSVSRPPSATAKFRFCTTTLPSERTLRLIQRQKPNVQPLFDRDRAHRLDVRHTIKHVHFVVC